MPMLKTILLDPVTWDLVVDINGNIAVAEPPYALAQDVASSCILFKGELLYDTTKGIPFFEDVLGKNMPADLMAGYFEAAALTVPGVVSAQATLITDSTRTVTGIIQFIDELGALNNVQF